MRWLCCRAGQQSVDLTAMLDLMLEHVQKQPVSAIGLHARVPIQAHVGAERSRGQRLTNSDEAAIDGRLLPCRSANSRAGIRSAQAFGLSQPPSSAAAQSRALSARTGGHKVPDPDFLLWIGRGRQVSPP